MQAIRKGLKKDLNAFAVSMLLLKRHESLVDRIRLILWYVIQGISVDGSRPVMLFTPLLKLCKLDEQLFLHTRRLPSDPEIYSCQI